MIAPKILHRQLAGHRYYAVDAAVAADVAVAGAVVVAIRQSTRVDQVKAPVRVHILRGWAVGTSREGGG